MYFYDSNGNNNTLKFWGLKIDGGASILNLPTINFSSWSNYTGYFGFNPVFYYYDSSTLKYLQWIFFMTNW